MNVKFDIRLPDIGDIAPKQEYWDRVLTIAMDTLLGVRKARIDGGMRVDGSPLLDGAVDSYSDAYEDRKERTVRYPYSPGDRYVWSGDMLNSMHPEIAVGIGKLVFSAEDAEKAYGNEMRRPGSLVPFSREEIDWAIREAIKQYRMERGDR